MLCIKTITTLNVSLETPTDIICIMNNDTSPILNNFCHQVIRRELHRTYDRVYATIYGQCVGDAIGLLTEGLKKSEVKKVKFVFHSGTICFLFFSAQCYLFRRIITYY